MHFAAALGQRVAALGDSGGDLGGLGGRLGWRVAGAGLV